MTAGLRTLDHWVKVARNELGKPSIPIGQRDFHGGAYLIVAPDDSEFLWIDDQRVRES